MPGRDEGWGIGVSLKTPDKLRRLQQALYGKAKQEPGACLGVKPIREPDDRNGQVRFDEREGETERWTTRRRFTIERSGLLQAPPVLRPPRFFSTLRNSGHGRQVRVSMLDCRTNAWRNGGPMYGSVLALMAR